MSSGFKILTAPGGHRLLLHAGGTGPRLAAPGTWPCGDSAVQRQPAEPHRGTLARELEMAKAKKDVPGAPLIWGR